MSVILKADNFTLAEDLSLSMRGLQTDEFNTIFGGHKALIDPMQSGVTGTLPAGSTIPNLVFNKPAATVVSGLLSQTVESAKGLPFASAAGGAEFGNLPPEFNLLNLGSEPSAVVSAWVTNRDLSQILAGILGCSYQTGTFSQWFISSGDTAGTIRLSGQGLKTQFTPELNVPELYSIYFKRVSAGNMQVHFARGDQVINTQSFTYPFKDPGASPVPNSSNPNFGKINGFGFEWDGIIHRVQCFKVDPATFNFSSWLADELSGNEGRFVS